MHADIEAAGYLVMGVSPQGVSSHKRFAQRLNLPFPLLADTRKSLIRAFGVNGPMGFGVRRATFVVGQDKTITHRHVSDFSIEAHLGFVRDLL